MSVKNLTALHAETLSTLVAKANTLGIQKEDVVTVMKLDDLFVLLYYR